MIHHQISGKCFLERSFWTKKKKLIALGLYKLKAQSILKFSYLWGGQILSMLGLEIKSWVWFSPPLIPAETLANLYSFFA